MINDLDNALQQLLELDLKGVLSGPVNISFDTPDSEFRPTGATVNLFLYDVRENRELHSHEWLVERQGNGTVQKKRPPVRVDCSYLVTAWAGDIQSEHSLLGEVMKVLLRYHHLPAGVLPSNLAGQEYELPTCTLQPGHLQSLGEFWQALGGKPKAALNYTVTIGVEAEKPVAAGTPVADKQIAIQQGMEEG
jgi:hypothetical protein